MGGAIPSSKPDISFYVPTWQRDSDPLKLVTLDIPIGKKCRWIIFDNSAELSQQTIKNLHAIDQDIIVIERGQNFEHKKPHYFTINPTSPEHYVSVFEKIILKEINDYAILHFWSADPGKFVIGKNLLDSSILYQGFYSGIFIAQALSQLGLQPSIFCTMVTTHVHSLLGDESVDPLKTTVLSLSRVLPLENPSIQIKNIDINCADMPENTQLYSRNIIDLTFKNMFMANQSIAETNGFRRHYRWMLSYKDIDLKNQPVLPLPITPNSVYLITGGLGGMGLTFANWLSAKTSSITIILISRTPFPEQTQWEKLEKKLLPENPIHQKIQLLKQIVNRGSNVIIKTADVADYFSMKKIVSDIDKHHGLLTGVFHLAGIASKGLAVLKQIEDIRSVLSPKIQGAWILARLLHRKKLDFVVFCSSLTAVSGGIGQVDYCAANIFLDSFMSSKIFKNCAKCLTIDWNAWASIGMAANLTDSKIHSELYAGNDLSPQQGTIVLNNLLASNYRQVIVSRFSPPDETQRIINTFNSWKLAEKEITHNTAYVYWSKTGVYENVANCWKEVLGTKIIHENDNFYALGGDSLLAIQLLMILQKRFNINISLQNLVHASTLSGMVKLIESRPVRSEQIIVPLCDHNQIDHKTIYFIHPLGGTVLCYFPFIPHLQKTFCYYAIQDPELMTGQYLFNSIQAMANYYADEISQHHTNKESDIILVGSSFGGNVAVEMVAQLKRKNILVQKIILIDSWVDLSKTKNNDSLYSQPPEVESIKTIRDYYGVNSDQYRLVQTRLSWLRSYQPTKINIPVVLLKAKEILPYYESISSKNNGWEPYFNELFTIYEITGNHDTMLKLKNLSKLCVLLKTLL